MSKLLRQVVPQQKIVFVHPSRGDLQMADRSLGLLSETIVPLSAVPQRLANQPHCSTVWRWTRRGVGGVKLETVRIGHAVFTSEEAVTRFLHRINSPAPADALDCQGSQAAEVAL